MIRAGHTMMVHEGKVYIVGGYTYRNNKLKKLFLMNEVVEAAVVTKDIIIIRKIVLTNLTGENIRNIYGFSCTSSETSCIVTVVMKSHITKHTRKIFMLPTILNVIATSCYNSHQCCIK